MHCCTAAVGKEEEGGRKGRRVDVDVDAIQNVMLYNTLALSPFRVWFYYMYKKNTEVRDPTVDTSHAMAVLFMQPR